MKCITSIYIPSARTLQLVASDLKEMQANHEPGEKGNRWKEIQPTFATEEPLLGN